MPRLNCTFAQFIAIIDAHGFKLHRHDGTSHRTYRGEVDGVVRLVQIAAHRMADPVKPKTLESMIRQTGLPKSLFRR